MIKLENYEVVGWEHAIRGMRNPKNSWERSDSDFGCRLKKGRDCVDWNRHDDGEVTMCKECGWCDSLCDYTDPHNEHREFIIGPNDQKLMMNLAKGGPVHAKYRRFIDVYVDITAPLYWWKEFDTYKVGTAANSCSTMHKIHDKEFTLDDFSHEHLYFDSKEMLEKIIKGLNAYREDFLREKNKDYWWQLIQMLPSSYNQKRTVKLNYEVLTGIYTWRKDHKLDEWREFCKWIESLPYSEIITGVEAGESDG
jgi:hypothetical protein